MTFSRWSGSSWVGFTTFKRWTGSAWQTIAQGRRWTGSIWSTFGFLSASLSPTNLSGSRATAGVAVTTGSCLATAVNGSGTYTYLWNVTTTLGPTVTAVSSTGASTLFQATVNGANSDAEGTATCTITDTVTGLSVTTSNSCSISLTYTGP